MSEKPVCQRCGYVGPVDARYCARCGRALVPPSVRLTSRINRILSDLSPVHIALLGLVLFVPISVFVDRLVVFMLSFPWSLVLLALVIGCGFAYLGWQWNVPVPSRKRLVRMVLVFVCIGVLLVAVLWIDRGLLSLLTDGTRQVVYKVPGVTIESSPGSRHLSIESDVPPYWLVVMIYGVLAAVAGSLIHRARNRRPI